MASAKPPGTAGALEASDLRSRLIGPFSFTWPLGECVAIEGESGAGKSLFLRLLADLDPNQGVVRLCGAVRNEMTATAWRRLAPYVPAEPGWWDDQVEAHFAVEDRGRLAALADALGLPHDRCAGPVARLSTGERQRLALIRGLLLESPLLLLDEPTGPLDPDATHRVETLLRARAENGMLVVMATHDPGQAERLGARRFRMHAGKLEPFS